MSAATARLAVGTRLDYDGARFEVVEMSGRRLLLRELSSCLARDGQADDDGPAARRWGGGMSPGGRVRQVDIAWLLAHPTTRIHTTGEEPEGQDPVDGGLGSTMDGPSVGVMLGDLDSAGRTGVAARVGHVQEVLTGYRRGCAELALPGEPRAAYGPGTTRMTRYAAKSAEIGIGISTLRRWVAAFTGSGPAGLVQERSGPQGGAGRVDPRWVAMCRQVLAGHVDASRPTRAIILAEVDARLGEEHGPGMVKAPARSVAYQQLAQLARGSNAFTGSTKAKRSIAQRPQGVYGRLRATRPGEYVLLDTTPLDVFAMEPVTCRWVRAELTAAMDLYTRAITGLRLTPVSTKAVDVAGVLYETLRPRVVHPGTAAGGDATTPGDVVGLAAVGAPGTVVIDAGRLVDEDGRRLLAGGDPQDPAAGEGLPSVAAETIVYDHGQIYVSLHVQSVCARFGISLQPARPATPTDKSPLERWFRTLADGLLVALPGYKGADVHSRGLDVEDEAFFFLDELEAIIREWVGLCYHRRRHQGLCIPQVPGLEVSPLEMLAHGIHRAGYMSVPTRPDLAYDFLPVTWTSIQHYGVQINGLRYDGPGLAGLRNRTSPYQGAHAGKWPIAVDPADVRAVYFQDQADHRWHTLAWEHAAALDTPFSAEALTYARRLAGRTQRFPDITTTLVDLLDRWGAGLTQGAAERRMAIRLSQQRLRLLPDNPAGQDAVTAPGSGEEVAGQVAGLPSVRRLAAVGVLPGTAGTRQDRPSPAAPPVGEGSDGSLGEPAGDDDTDDEVDADIVVTTLAATAPDPPTQTEDFYADVMDSG